MNPVYDFKGQVAFVTGSASGMGLATSRAFAEAGAAVALIDANDAALTAAAQALKDEGHDVLPILCDVSDEAQVRDAVARTVERFGRLDMAFNNAGIQSDAKELAQVAMTDYDHMLGINLRGVFACMKYQLAQMQQQGSGAIVNCSSLGGFVGVPGRAAYHAAKHGIHGMSKSAALEYAPLGIRINVVAPGIMDTPMVAEMKQAEAGVIEEMMRDVPIKRLGRAEEVSAAVLWLCSPAASFVVGHALAVDGGYVAR
ncbi:SDR family oxidoreductase [Sphingomonas sp. 2R-10]|uniref:SDR family NAD(P)-dependent oxidoreductase n=1 Tax=Sphingomonas sp. 2R-10 TaxID=3045148 RepID=UPI000F77C591|nr:SDR family oxidoreductase [Sphingomonas sp. 2R-10]MDJ0276235.1 SDR family oxidoreductase [Sphingomonas sp. 2R-10]